MRIYLTKHGIPFDVAFAAHDDWTFAAYVALVESEGFWSYDFDTEQWNKR